MSRKLKVCSFLLLTVLLASLSFAVVSAQAYKFKKTLPFTIGSDGVFTLVFSEVGITYDIQGTPGTTGSVTTVVWNGDPQSGAGVPANTSLSYFFGSTFDTNINNFEQAVVTVSYTDSDVQGVQEPYRVFKYVSDSNSYVELPASVYTNTKTITVALDSLSNPVLAVGGTTAEAVPPPTYLWVLIPSLIFLIVLVAVIIFMRLRRRRSEDYAVA